MTSGWERIRIGLLVTGEGEEQFIVKMLRALAQSGRCILQVVRRMPQLSPRTSAKPKRVTMAGTKKGVFGRDAEYGLEARKWMIAQHDDVPRFVVVLDDLEHDTVAKGMAREKYARYRAALDTILGADADRAAVHFFHYMVEAYYFGDLATVSAVVGQPVNASGLARDDAWHTDDDVESIRHPKNELKKQAKGFDEVIHGRKIASKIDLDVVLSDSRTCASLRALVAWCTDATGGDHTRFALDIGAQSVLTGSQIARVQRARSRVPA